MNRQAFGDQIDIHGGGRDLIFPHHENEIAQSEALTGKQFAKYWIHNGLIKVNGQKMSKSLGNSLLLADLLDAFSPEAVKYALLQTNYRGDINVTDNLFKDAEKHMYGFYKTLAEVGDSGLTADYSGSGTIDEEFNRAMDDDFNTAKALADLFGIFKSIKAKLKAGDGTAVGDAEQVVKTYGLLGLFKSNPKEFISEYEAKNKQDVPDKVLELVAERAAAKQNRDWGRADAIRDEIAKLGYAVKDTKDGVVVEKL